LVLPSSAKSVVTVNIIRENRIRINRNFYV
jgi:hypothetical protein